MVRLELDELLGHVVVVALGEDAQDGEAGLVHVDAFAQRQPAGDAAFRGHVLQLQDGHAHGAVLPSKAVVFHTHLQLVALRTHLVAQGAAKGNKEEAEVYTSISTSSPSLIALCLQSERLVVFRSPAVVLGLGGVLPLFVAQMRADDVDLHERAEYSLCLPSQVVSSHH